MKPSISKETLAYLDQMERGEASSDEVYMHQPDELDKLIYTGGLRIQNIYFEKQLDVMIVLLNNRKLIQRPISDFKRLAKATEEQLHEYELDGIDIHWPSLDEDLSLKGFLQYEMNRVLQMNAA